MSETVVSSSKGSNTSSNNESENQVEEWKTSRDMLQFYDDKLDALRKYGFTFLTTLLAAESILIPPKTGEVGMSDQVKLAVFSITLLLVAALYLLDKNYRIFQDAANTRAIVLERKLNLELSETIAYRFKADGISRRILVIYSLFIFGVLALGCFVLYPSWIFIAVLVVLALAAFIYIQWQHRQSLCYRYGYEDWTVSPLECKAKDATIRITLNNLTKKSQVIKSEPADLKKATDLKGFPFSVPEPIVFQKGDLIWEISSEDGTEVHRKTADEITKVYYSYTWTLNLKKTGVHQIRTGGWPIPLFTIIVSDNTG